MVIRFLIANAFSVGGTIRTTFMTAGELADRHEVEVVSVYRRAETRALDLDPRVRLRTLADLRPAALAGSPDRRLAERPSEMIHPDDARFDKFNLLTDRALQGFLSSVRDGALIGTRPGLNLAIAGHVGRGVVTVGQDHLNLEGYRPDLVRAIGEHYGALHAVTALTEDTAAKYRDLIGPQARTRVLCVPNPAPPPSERPAPLDAQVVASAGTLSYRKGVDRLLRGWALAAPDRPGWRLDLYGTGDYRPKLQELIAHLGVTESVRLRGHSPRLLEDLHGASVFAMASRREGFPMVLLEAMSAGVPVVAYDCPTGPRDIVTDGVDGRLVPNSRPRLLGAALGELMDDPALRKALGAGALQTAARYQLGALGARWERLLGELAAAN